jgi:hypothetical protein
MKPMRFDIAGTQQSSNGRRLFAAWMWMFEDMLRAKGIAAKLRTLLAPPD